MFNNNKRIAIGLSALVVALAAGGATAAMASGGSSAGGGATVGRQIVAPRHMPAPINTPASLTLSKKVYAVVDGSTGSLIRGSHAVSASLFGAGQYLVTFDRHVDNCALVASMGFDGTISNDHGPLADKIIYAVLDAPDMNKTVLVNTLNLDSGGTPGSEQSADSDFHIIGLCPGT